MDEQKETITSYDPETGEAKEVNLVLDHDRQGGMKLSVEQEQGETQKER
ncbi:MAG: hypothetical protein K0S39_3385 [Paenibacillus sp.]|jgi:hypothetical protein|nr:hypothetical protein [Paenibacillus sp.]